MFRSLVVGALLAIAPAALAQSQPVAQLSGHTWDQAASAALPGCEVRLWEENDKGSYDIVQTASSASDGSFAFAIPVGVYKVDARAPITGGYADRWYDVAPPTADGWVGSDADSFDVTDATDVTGVDIVMVPSGGLDAYVVDARDSTPLGGIQARLLRLADPRIHHNDQTRGSPYLGHFYMRDLPPADDYLLLLYDPKGVYALTTDIGPFPVSVGAVTDSGTTSLELAQPDPYEPNGDPGEITAFSVDPTGLLADPPQNWASAGASIAAGGDPDWYCWHALAGDRYFVYTTSLVDVQGEKIRNPWLDPMLSFWDVSGTAPVLRFADDDSGPDRDAFIDTGPLPADADVCAVVTTYGDPTFDGSGQQSNGPYELDVEMGNRAPSVALQDASGNPVPPPPDTLSVTEAVPVMVTALLSDPEQDLLTTTATFVDGDGQPVTGWAFDRSGDTGTFSWTPDQTAAASGPYTLTVTTADAEFSTSRQAVIAVATTNVPPTTPLQVSPTGGDTIDQSFPVLTITNATDADGDPLSYAFQAWVGQVTDTPDASSTVAEGLGGTTSSTMPFVADGSDVWWRVRADDGHPGGRSPWTQYAAFHVETHNDPPAVPVLDKPSAGEQVLSHRPALKVVDSPDPEHDQVSVIYQVAADTTFATPITTSPAISEVGVIGHVESWTVDTDLPWGSVVFWRARAVDSHGAQSDWSAASHFEIKPDVAPTVPTLQAPWDAACEGVVLHAAPTSFPVANATDPEGDALQLELQVVDFDQPDGTPVFDTTLAQADGASTDVVYDGTGLQENGHYLVRVRASDGTLPSMWSQCDFWLDAVQSPVTGFAFTSPAEGTALPWNTSAEPVVISNPTSPDDALPHAPRALTWCVDRADGDPCGTDPATWNQLEFQPGDSTSFQVAGLVPGKSWTVHACDLDAGNQQCITSASVGFTTDPMSQQHTGSGSGGGCGGCDGGGAPSSLWWAPLLVVVLRRRRA